MALLLEIIAGYDMRDAASLPVAPRRLDVTPGSLKGLRIAFTPDLGFAAVSPDVRAAFSSAVETLAELGAEMVSDPTGIDPEALERTIKPIAYTEQAAAIMGREEALLSRSDLDYNTSSHAAATIVAPNTSTRCIAEHN